MADVCCSILVLIATGYQGKETFDTGEDRTLRDSGRDSRMNEWRKSEAPK